MMTARPWLACPQASIAEDPTHFLPVVRRLLGCFRGASGAKLLQRRGALIVQLICKRLGGQQVGSGGQRKGAWQGR